MINSVSFFVPSRIGALQPGMQGKPDAAPAAAAPFGLSPAVATRYSFSDLLPRSLSLSPSQFTDVFTAQPSAVAGGKALLQTASLAYNVSTLLTVGRLSLSV